MTIKPSDTSKLYSESSCFHCLSKICLNFVLFQIESTWVENFAEDYAEGISKEDQDHVMQQLVSKVKSQKLSFPGVPQSFREFMVTFHSLCMHLQIGDA